MNLRFYTLLAVSFFCFTTVANAKIFRVGYTGPQVTGTDYTNFQEAHDEANPGDTLLFYPGNSYTGNASTPLVYMGYGYYLSGVGANEGLQLITGTLLLSINLHTGSSGSHFEGIGDGNGSGYLQLSIQNAVDDISIRRCWGPTIYSYTADDCVDWQITQSYQVYLHAYGGGGTGRFLNLRVESCHIGYLDLSNLTAGSNGQVSNCVIISAGVVAPGASIYFKNNIVQGASFSSVEGSLFENNLFDFAEGTYNIPSGDGNQFSVNMTDVFVGPTGNSTDGQWQLKAGSPAIGAGVDGIDCGMFAGTNPYRLSGIPSIPVFYKLTAPSHTATTNPYTITFSVKSNN